MKTEQEIQAAVASCERAQIENNTEICPVYEYEEESPLDCLNCTCRDAWNWLLKD